MRSFLPCGRQVNRVQRTFEPHYDWHEKVFLFPFTQAWASFYETDDFGGADGLLL